MSFSLITNVAFPSNVISGGDTSGSPKDTSGANLIVLGVSYYAAIGTPSTPTDNKGNTYTARTAIDNSSFNGAPVAGVQLFDCAAPTVGSGDYWSIGGSDYAGVYAAAFSGADTSPHDKENFNGNKDESTLQSGSVTPTNSGDL